MSPGDKWPCPSGGAGRALVHPDSNLEHKHGGEIQWNPDPRLFPPHKFLLWEEEERRGRSHEFSLSQFTKSTVLVFLFYVGFCLAGKEKKSIDGIESQVGAGRRATGSLRFRCHSVQTINHQQQGLSEPCNFSSIFPGIVGWGCSSNIRHQLLECRLLLQWERRKRKKMLQSEGRCFFSRRIRTQIRRKRKNSCGTGRASSKVLRRMRDVGRPKKKAEGVMGESKKNLFICTLYTTAIKPVQKY